MSELGKKEPQMDTDKHRCDFLEKLLDLSADQAGGAEACLSGRQVEWVALGEVSQPKRGKRLVKSQLEESGSFAVYQNSMKPLGYYEESNVAGETPFIICAGAAGLLSSTFCRNDLPH